MKKFFLVLFILFDLLLIAGGTYVLFRHVKGRLPLLKTMVKRTVVTPAPGSVSPSTAPVRAAGSGLLSAPPTAPTESGLRKIKFAYRNSNAKQVSIRADFTGWKAEPMQKEAGGTWTYVASLTPGEYAYCFTVGERIINDPANKRTKVIGRTTVSSIVVEALAPKAGK